MLFRYRRLGPRYEVWASIVATLVALIVVLAACAWALQLAP